jgi:hypothetical protein
MQVGVRYEGTVHGFDLPCRHRYLVQTNRFQQ